MGTCPSPLTAFGYTFVLTNYVNTRIYDVFVLCICQQGFWASNIASGSSPLFARWRFLALQRYMLTESCLVYTTSVHLSSDKQTAAKSELALIRDK